jgi:hypothetical protein
VIRLNENLVSTAAAAPNRLEQNEMMVPGSVFTPQGKRSDITSQRGIISIRTADETVVGMASRVKFNTKTYLMTALHTASLIEMDAIHSYYIEHNGLKVPFDFKAWTVVARIINLDVLFLEPLRESVWSSLGVKSLALGMTQDAQPVSLFGYKDGKFVTSSGRMEVDDFNFMRYKHTASTDFGWSGTPILVAGNIVGIHTSRGDESDPHNIAVGNWWELLVLKQETPYLLRRSYNVMYEGADAAYRNSGNKKARRFKIEAFSGNEYDIVVIGRNVYIDSGPRNNQHHTVEDDLEDIYDDNYKIIHEMNNVVHPGSPFYEEARYDWTERKPYSDNLDLVGSCALSQKAGKPKSPTAFMVRAFKVMPALQAWAFPPKGVAVESKSLKFHMATCKTVAVTKKMREYYLQAAEILASSLPKTKVPKEMNMPYVPGMDLPEIDRKRFTDFVRQELLDSKTPGMPFMIGSKLNSHLKEERLELFVDFVMKRFKVLLNLDLSVDHTPEQLVQMGASDPSRVFIKDEPHKVSKLEQGRPRIICSVSSADNIIQKYLFKTQNSAEIDEWKTIPIKPGMGITTDDQIQTLAFEQFRLSATQKRRMEDVSYWDYSVQAIDFEMELNVRLKCNQGYGTVWEKISQSSYYCLNRKLYILSDGTMLAQTNKGVLPSGVYITASFNSKVRAMTADVAASLERGFFVHVRPTTMGDDGMYDDVFKDSIKAFARIGRTVKPGGIVMDFAKGFEFCSTIFKKVGDRFTAHPLNVEKQLWNLLCDQSNFTTPEMEYNDFMLRFQQHPKKKEYFNVLESCGFIESLNQGKDEAISSEIAA